MRRAAVLLVMVSAIAFAAPIVRAAAPAVVTRAEFCVQLASALGLQPVSPPTPTFGDVPTSSPDYSVIEAVYQAGWISGVQPGVFDPNGSLTRAQAAKIEVLALGDKAAAQSQMTDQTSFSDNKQIPSWARGYIVEANRLGLISGFLNGEFKPNGTLTTQDAAAFIRKLTTVWMASAYTVSVSTSSNPVAVGQIVGLSAKVTNRDGAQIWAPFISFASNSPNAVVSGSELIASEPGTYKVTATYSSGANTYTGSTHVTVSGPASSVHINVPSMVVTNGQTQTQVQVDLLDAQGNLAVGNNGTTVELTVTGTAFTAPSTPLTTTTVAGVATFSLVDGSVPGSFSTLTATDVSNGAKVQANVTGEAQVPAKIVVTAPTGIAVNKPDTTATLQIALQDASSQPIIWGGFPLTVSVTGPATFTNGVTAPKTVVYTGNGQPGSSPAYANVTIQDVQGETGKITVSIQAQGVPTATTTIMAVIGGRQNQLMVTAPATPVTRDQTAAGVSFTLSATDGNGLPAAVTNPTPLLIAVTNSAGVIAQDFTVDGNTQQTSGYVDNLALEDGHFTIADTAKSPDVGTYTVQVSDPSGKLLASTPVSFNVTAGSAAGISAKLGTTGLWVKNPKTTLTVQVVDAYGNPVALAGVPVQVASATSNPFPVTISPDSGVTNGNGQFTTTVEAQAEVQPLEAINVSATINGHTVVAFPRPVFIVQAWGPN